MNKLCECGCGQELERPGKPSRPRRFLFGHQGKGKPSKTRTTIQSVLLRLVICEPKTLETGCWEYSGRRNDQGYGSVDFEGSTRSAHRLVYEHFVGPIPEDKELHHRCENRCCCNFEHLEALTDTEHRRKRMGAHCKNGHEFTPENTRINGRQRICRTCMKKYSLDYYYRNQEKRSDYQRRYKSKPKA